MVQKGTIRCIKYLIFKLLAQTQYLKATKRANNPLKAIKSKDLGIKAIDRAQLKE
jgi:hypothetical protein